MQTYAVGHLSAASWPRVPFSSPHKFHYNALKAGKIGHPNSTMATRAEAAGTSSILRSELQGCRNSIENLRCHIDKEVEILDSRNEVIRLKTETVKEMSGLKLHITQLWFYVS